MLITECELTRLRTPFRTAFKHAAATRATSDAIVVMLRTAQGTLGFGEIQARPYVSGESNDAIWDSQAEVFARNILGRSFGSVDEIQTFTTALLAKQSAPALIGGFDLGLMDAFELEHEDPWTALLGPPSNKEPGKCLTIGEDVDGPGLLNQARLARIGGYSVVKLKVSGAKDAARVRALRDGIGAAIALRLDANGTLDRATAEVLLTDAREAAIQSIEEPLPKNLPGLAAELARLYESTSIPIVADESICTLRDLEHWAAVGGYQIVNIRIGKSGGVSGTIAVLKAALGAGFGVVSGTMVGETAVMLRASRKLLQHCDAIDYVEGINQARQLLEAESIVARERHHDRHFEWLAEGYQKYRVDHKIIT